MGEISWTIVSDPLADPGLIESWDRLAIAAGLPYCAPAWMISFAEGPEGEGELRIGVARDSDRIVGVYPLVARGRSDTEGARYELPGSGIGYRIEPLADADVRDAVVAASGELLTALDPPLGDLVLHGLDHAAGWGEAIAGSYPGSGARLHRGKRLHASVLEFGEPSSYGTWLQTKSRHFRKRADRDLRRFQEVGELRIASTAAEVTRATAAFAELHLARWRDHGRSNLDYPGMPAQLAAAGDRLGPERLRAVMALVDEEIVAVDIFVRAGAVTASWNGGWNTEFRDLRPGWLTLMAGIEDAIESGVREVDLGPGAHPWKERLATRDAPLVSDRLVPRSSGQPR